VGHKDSHPFGPVGTMVPRGMSKPGPPKTRPLLLPPLNLLVAAGVGFTQHYHIHVQVHDTLEQAPALVSSTKAIDIGHHKGETGALAVLWHLPAPAPGTLACATAGNRVPGAITYTASRNNSQRWEHTAEGQSLRALAGAAPGVHFPPIFITTAVPTACIALGQISLGA